MGEGSAAVQVAPGVWRFESRGFPSNSYVVATGRPGRCVLVDPGVDPEGLESCLAALGLEPSHVLCTHGHFDHVGGAALFQARHGVPCYLHEADVPVLARGNFLMMAFKIPFVMERPRTTAIAEVPAVIDDRPFTVLDAPGHTPGSCVFFSRGVLFSGDTLYARGVGLSKLPGGDGAQLRATLLRLWDRIPDETLVCPGHGGVATFADVRAENLPLLRFLGLDSDGREARGPERVGA